MRDGSIDADGIEADRCGNDPESWGRKGPGNGFAQFCGDVLILVSNGAFADKCRGEGKAYREGEQAEDEVGGAPSQVSDDGLGEDRKQHGSQRAAGEHDGERETAPAVEPCRDSAGVPDVSSPVADQADEKEGEIEVQQMRREQCERSIGSRENRQCTAG
jgi:hypothetical protein